MMSNGGDEDFSIARPIDHAKGKALHELPASAFERRSATVWIGDRLLYRAFDCVFKPDAQAIANTRVVGDFFH